MKSYSGSFIIGLIIIVSTGCARKTLAWSPSPNTSELPAPFQNKVFTGVIPCADCPGIQTELILRDSSYHLSSIYLDRDQKPLTQKGLFSWNPKIQIVSLDNGTSFQLDKDQLFMLNKDGRRIKGALSKHYALTPTTLTSTDSLVSQLAHSSWFLIELNDQKIDPDQWTEEPFLIFSPAEKRIHGNAGCNSFFGSYMLQADTLILSGMASTKRFCTNSLVEDQFLKILSSNCKITLNENLLTITNLESKVSALFIKTSAKQP